MGDGATAFQRQLDVVRLAAMRAGARIADKADQVEGLSVRITSLQREAPAATGPELAARFELSDDELGFVWAVVAATVDPLLAVHLPPLGPRVGSTGISLAQHAVLADLAPARAATLARGLSSGHRLVLLRLVETATGGPPSSVAGWVASARLVGFLAGDEALDPGLRSCGGLIPAPAAVGSDAARDAVVDRVRELLAGPPVVIVLEGKRGVGRRTVVACATERPVVSLDIERVARAPAALAEALAALGREVVLRGAVPVVVGVDDVLGGEPDVVVLRRELARFVDRLAGAAVLVTNRAVAHVETAKPVVRLELPMPGPTTRAALWWDALGAAAATAIEGDVTHAAARFQLGPAGIRAAAANAWAFARAAGLAAPTAAHLTEGVRTTVEERLHGLARRVETRVDWPDVVLPADTRQQLGLMIARVKHAYQVLESWRFARHLPGPGVAALFSGAPGTGKTMVAGIIARTLGLELYQVDLSQIVSKWIGETEKQLDAVFSAAETGHAMLLFDEADALFAKRTEVKGATERYANLEVNFLLQRIERFAGVAILTTNLDGSLDPALRRRLAAHIQFPAPDEDERAELWRRLMPREAPVAPDIDVARLAADFPGFAGAHIRNALTTAAFLAAAAGRPISQAMLHHAGLEEARAMGRMVKTGGSL